MLARFGPPSPSMVVALIALVLAAGGIGYATIPDSSGTIHACYLDRYTRTQPLFRVIDPDQGQACRPNEIPLSWKDFEGAAAGGDLIGTHPNPSIASDAVTGAKVLNNSLSGADIDEGSLDLPVPIVIQRHEFDTTATYFNTTTDWQIVTTGGGVVNFDPTNSVIQMENPSGGGAAVRGRRQASLTGTLVFKARVFDAYAESVGVYGDRQPRGLANGTDRSNAIEFVNTSSAGFPSNFHVGCRTVASGTATETGVNIGQSVREPAVYEIVAKSNVARFYVNGVLVCTHTTNIPTTPLNIYFGTSNDFGNIPHTVDWVSFERT